MAAATSSRPTATTHASLRSILLGGKSSFLCEFPILVLVIDVSGVSSDVKFLHICPDFIEAPICAFEVFLLILFIIELLNGSTGKVEVP